MSQGHKLNSPPLSREPVGSAKSGPAWNDEEVDNSAWQSHSLLWFPHVLDEVNASSGLNAYSDSIFCSLPCVLFNVATLDTARCNDIAERIFLTHSETSHRSHSAPSHLGLKVISVSNEIGVQTLSQLEAPRTSSSARLSSPSSTPQECSLDIDISKQNQEHPCPGPSLAHRFSWTVLWDIENVAVPQAFNGVQVVRKLCAKLSTMRGPEHNDPVRRILAFTNVTTLRVSLRNELQSNGVSLHHVESRGRKEAADKALITELCMSSLDKEPPAGIALISGDQDFAYSLARMRNMGYTTVVIAPHRSACSPFLTSVPDVVWSFTKDVLGEVTPRKGPSRSPRKPKRSNASSPASVEHKKERQGQQNANVGAQDSVLAEVRLLCQDLKSAISANMAANAKQIQDVKPAEFNANEKCNRQDITASSSPAGSAPARSTVTPPRSASLRTERPPRTVRVLSFDVSTQTEDGQSQSTGRWSLSKRNCRIVSMSVLASFLILLSAHFFFFSLVRQLTIDTDAVHTGKVPRFGFVQKIALSDVVKSHVAIMVVIFVVVTRLFYLSITHRNYFVPQEHQPQAQSPGCVCYSPGRGRPKRNRRISTLKNPANV